MENVKLIFKRIEKCERERRKENDIPIDYYQLMLSMGEHEQFVYIVSFPVAKNDWNIDLPMYIYRAHEERKKKNY